MYEKWKELKMDTNVTKKSALLTAPSRGGALSQFEDMDASALAQTEGGLFPIVIGGIVIGKGAAIAGGLLLGGGIGLGMWEAYRN